MFEVSYQRQDWHSSEMIIFVFLGITMGIYGALFCKLNILWSRTFRSTKWVRRFPWLEVLLVAFVTATVGWYSRYARIAGPRLVEDLLSECSKGGREKFDGVCPGNVVGMTGLMKGIVLAIGLKILLYFNVVFGGVMVGRS